MPDKAPFGAYAPSPFQEWARARAGALKRRTFITKQLRSLYIRLAGGKKKGAIFDVQVFGNQRVRLHPTDNKCEDRVYCAAQFWDAKERQILGDALRRCNDEPFVFVDIGANVGLYSLYMRSVAKDAGKTLDVIAVEPSPVTLERLKFNMDASGAENITILPCAVTARTGEEVELFLHATNLGQNKLGGEGRSIKVKTRSLADVFAESKSKKIHAMKIDIEGAERPALEGMFQSAPKSLWPRLIVIETKDQSATDDPAGFCIQHGYQPIAHMKMNSILEFHGAP